MKGHFTPHTEETKQKIRLAKLGQPSPMKGKKHTEEARRKISEAGKGRPNPNKGGTAPWAIGNQHGKGRTPWNKGLHTPPNRTSFKKGHVPALKGKKNPKITGPCHHNWKGGVTPENRKFRTSAEYLAWRDAVLRRDRFTCQACGTRGKQLEVDHVMPFALFPELRLDTLNGRVLCRPCHRKINTRNTHWLSDPVIALTT